MLGQARLSSHLLPLSSHHGHDHGRFGLCYCKWLLKQCLNRWWTNSDATKADLLPTSCRSRIIELRSCIGFEMEKEAKKKIRPPLHNVTSVSKARRLFITNDRLECLYKAQIRHFWSHFNKLGTEVVMQSRIQMPQKPLPGYLLAHTCKSFNIIKEEEELWASCFKKNGNQDTTVLIDGSNDQQPSVRTLRTFTFTCLFVGRGYRR